MFRTATAGRSAAAGPPPLTDSRGEVIQTSQVQRQTRLGPAAIRQLRADYQAGQTSYQLAATYRLHRQTVTKHLRTAGIKLRGGGLDQAQTRDAIARYQAGQSLATIGQQFGVTANTVAAALERAGIPRRDTHGRAR
jgi:hypothetical protein